MSAPPLPSLDVLADCFDRTTDLVQVVDAGGRFVMVNRRWHEVLGYRLEDLERLSALDVVHPDHRAECALIIEAFGRGEAPPDVETVLLTRDGEAVPAEGGFRYADTDGGRLCTGIFHETSGMGAALRALERERDLRTAQATALLRAVERLQQFLWRLQRTQDFTQRIENPKLARCWLELGCDRTDCPAFGQNNCRCWQLAGTHCAARSTGKFAERLEHCEQCSVYQQATPGAVYGLIESFNNMVHIAGSKHAELQQTLGRLEQANRLLTKLAATDPLMGVGNRRGLEEAANRHHHRCARQGRAYAILVVDVDYFKAYNDRYGHPAGDHVLVSAADLVRATVRAEDEVFRYGGDEIAVVLVDGSLDAIRRVGDQVSHRMAARGLPHAESPLGVVTLSVGGASQDPSRATSSTWQDLLARADDALYRAKRAGRNRVEIAAPNN
jgi:diguanylate cyclase (GGDEF)-like protein/PAS domain S-box-containing protein